MFFAANNEDIRWENTNSPSNAFDAIFSSVERNSMNEVATKDRTNLFLDSSSFPPIHYRHPIPSQPEYLRRSVRSTTAVDCANMLIGSSHSYKRRVATTTAKSPLGRWVDLSKRYSSHECHSDLSDSEDEEEPLEMIRELRWCSQPSLTRHSSAPNTPHRKCEALDAAITPPRRRRSAGNLKLMTR